MFTYIMRDIPLVGFRKIGLLHVAHLIKNLFSEEGVSVIKDMHFKLNDNTT